MTVTFLSKMIISVVDEHAQEKLMTVTYIHTLLDLCIQFGTTLQKSAQSVLHLYKVTSHTNATVPCGVTHCNAHTTKPIATYVTAVVIALIFMSLVNLPLRGSCTRHIKSAWYHII